MRRALLEANRVDRFLLVAPLGRGGMGVVHRAWDTVLRRDVAVKLLAPEERGAPGARALERFRREGEALARVRHPNVVCLHEAGRLGAAAYLVMDLVEGPSLADVLQREGPLAPARAAAVVRDVASGLGCVHAQGLVHRDVKPANVLLAGERAVLADFGLALDATGELERLTQTGAVVGTPIYLSPEQVGRREPGPPSDVFAAGNLLYECLTSAPPFGGNTLLEILSRITLAAPTPPSAVRKDVPPALERIVMRCLRADPAERYPNGDALAAALDAFLRGDPDDEPRRLRSRLIGALGFVALVSAGALALGSPSEEREQTRAPAAVEASPSQASTPRRAAPRPRKTALPARQELRLPAGATGAIVLPRWDDEGLVALDDAAELVRWRYRADGSLADGVLLARAPAPAPPSPEAPSNPPCWIGGARGPFVDERGVWWAEPQPSAVGLPRPVLPVHPCVATCAPGDRLLVLGLAEGALLVDLVTRERIGLLPSSDVVQTLFVDPERDALLVGCGAEGKGRTLVEGGGAGRLERWSLRDLQRVPTAPVEALDVPWVPKAVALDPRRDRLLVGTSVGQVRAFARDALVARGELVDAAAGGAGGMLRRAALGNVRALVVIGDALLVGASDASELSWWDLRRDVCLQHLPLEGRIVGAALAPDASRVAIGTDQGRVVVVRVP
ncbi:MAG: serine/threonine-protein kinase [Planctomycetota bacterium]